MRKFPSGRCGKNALSSSRLSTFATKDSSVSEGQRALEEVKALCEKRMYKEALPKIEWIKAEYPSCSKAATYYLGLAKYEVAKEEGGLPTLSHMKD